MHVQFDKNLTPLLQSVRVTLHDSMVFKDFINMTDYQHDEKTLTVESIGKSTMSEYDYFGFAVATVKPFKELKRLVPVKITFNYRDGAPETYTEYARIFRPLLELDDSPTKITMTDSNADRLDLPLAMKFSGFGQIKVRTECLIEGRIVSFASSMLNEITRKIIRDGIVPTDHDSATGVKIHPDYVEQTVSQVGSLLQSGDKFSEILDMLRDGTGAEALRALGPESKKKLLAVLYNTVETYMTQVIAEILDRNVGANLAVEPTKIRAQISLPVTKVTVRLFYRDLVGNTYEPIEKQVEIVDKRKNPAGIDVQIPLNITGVDESSAYKNVGTMEVELCE